MMKRETILLWCFNYESAKSSLTNIFIHFHINPSSSDPRFNLNSFLSSELSSSTWARSILDGCRRLDFAASSTRRRIQTIFLYLLYCLLYPFFFSRPFFPSSGFRFGLRVKWLIIFRLEIHFIDFLSLFEFTCLVKVRCRPPPTVLSPSPTKYLWFRHYRKSISSSGKRRWWMGFYFIFK